MALLRLTLLLPLLAAPAWAQPVDVTLAAPSGRCATPSPSPALVDAHGRAVAAHRAATAAQHRRPGSLSDFVAVPVVYHVIHDGLEGNLPLATLEAQTDVLNAAFEAMGFQFFIAEVNRVDDPEWYRGIRAPSSPVGQQMKTALARNPSVFLNLYTARLADELLGFATFPGPGQADDPLQGVVVLDATLPGGAAAPYDEGDTAVHEVGHWLGLYHTFEGGCHDAARCETAGDRVCDTPAEARSATGCPAGRDTCPSEGPDPTSNYMNYVDDACMDTFTPGQRERAHALMSAFRPEIMDGPESGFFATPSVLAFGSVAVGTPRRRDVRLFNFTERAVRVTASLAGDGAFTVAQLAFTVAAGETATVPVTFEPAADRPYAATLTLETDEASFPTHAVALTGGGVLPPAGALDRTGLVLRAGVRGSDAASFDFTNAGLGPLSYTVTGASGYLQASPAAGTVEPGGRATVTVTADAALLVAGVYQRFITVRTNDANLSGIEYPVVFAVGGALPPPALLAPLNGAAEVPTDLALAWTPVAEAEAYEVEVATDAGFSAPAFAVTTPEAGFAAAADASTTYHWRVRTLAGAETSAWSLPFAFATDSVAAVVPAAFSVGAPYPNPASGAVALPVRLAAAAAVTARAYDLAGRHVATLAAGRVFGPGAHELTWDASQHAAGVYLLQVAAEGYTASQRLVVLR